MTHSLHRRGDRESLKKDFLILSSTAKGYNDGWYRGMGQEFMRICLKHNPVNGGDMKTGNFLYVDPQEIIDRCTNSTILEFTYDHKEDVIEAIKEFKARDIGVSVVISGMSEEVDDICEKAGLPKVHTREYSLGTSGKVRLLPEYEVLEFTTMCGHAMVASEIVKKMIVDAKKGNVTLREAAVQMGKCCSCGNFNVNRAVELMEKNAPLWTADDRVY